MAGQSEARGGIPDSPFFGFAQFSFANDQVGGRALAADTVFEFASSSREQSSHGICGWDSIARGAVENPLPDFELVKIHLR
jgi:hypothetical protein